MSAQGSLLELAGRHGIEHGYHDIWGTWHALSASTARSLLAGMGVDASSEESISDALRDLQHSPWRSLAPPVVVIRDDQACEVILNIADRHDDSMLRWHLVREDGDLLEGAQGCAQLEVLDEHVLDAATIRRRRLVLPAELPHGYHRLHIEVGDRGCSLTMIRTPVRCVFPDDVRLWGVCLQLYGLRSATNWGIGDFGDLQRTVQILAAYGADFVGLNPLHALYLDSALHISPYSPSSRVYINALYLHVESMNDFDECEQARSMVVGAGFQSALAALRHTELVDYPGVSRCKRAVFECLFEHFERVHLDGRNERSAQALEFGAFCDTHGADLHQHAVFEALHEHFAEDGGLICKQTQNDNDDMHGNAVRGWPPEFLKADGAAVAQFANRYARRVVYFKYLQWQCAIQLKRCRAQASSSGMRLGLYLDLAVGSDGQGADVWTESEYYATGVSVGAPADDFAPQGQVWGLPPLRADCLRDAGYEPFIRCLRANMCHAGVLRIDHVLGLLRLFWVPEGSAATAGAYVHYPVDELLAITALESERSSCVVVGEDLGTVPDAMREALARFGVLSYRVFYFEKHWHGDHSFRGPHHYPQDALVTLATHDLPTLIGFWTGRDLRIRHELGLFSSAEFEAQQGEMREYDRARILKLLRDEGLWPTSGGALQSLPSDDALLAGEEPSRDLMEAIYRLLARSNSSLLSVQIEDVLAVAEQVNVPGTVNEQPNWRRKLPLEIDKWHEHAGLAALSAAIATER